MFTLAGYTVTTKAQAQSVHLIAMLKGDLRLAQQASAVAAKLA